MECHITYQMQPSLSCLSSSQLVALLSGFQVASYPISYQLVALFLQLGSQWLGCYRGADAVLSTLVFASSLSVFIQVLLQYQPQPKLVCIICPGSPLGLYQLSQFVGLLSEQLVVSRSRRENEDDSFSSFLLRLLLQGYSPIGQLSLVFYLQAGKWNFFFIY